MQFIIRFSSFIHPFFFAIIPWFCLGMGRLWRGTIIVRWGVLLYCQNYTQHLYNYLIKKCVFNVAIDFHPIRIIWKLYDWTETEISLWYELHFDCMDRLFKLMLLIFQINLINFIFFHQRKLQKIVSFGTWACKHVSSNCHENLPVFTYHCKILCFR